jgi:hypothetical protein
MLLLILTWIPPIDSLSKSLSAIQEILLINDTSLDLFIDAIGDNANIIKCLCTKVDKSQLIDLFPSMAKPLEYCLDIRLQTCA